MKTLLRVFLLLLCSSTQAQTLFFDNFEDGSITNPANSSSTPASLAWLGNTGRFQVNTTAPVLAGSYSIRSNTTDIPSAIRATFPSGITFANSNLTWRFLYRNNNNVAVAANDIPTAAADSWRIWLAASTTNRTTANGYILAQKGNQLLLRMANQSTSIYTDIASCNISGATTYSIRVTRRSDGTWRLFVDAGTGEAVTDYGGAANTAVSMPATFYTLFDSNNTAANTNGFIWDDYRISRTYLQADCNDNTVQSTDIYSGDTNKAIFSFRLTATENVPLKFIYISSSYNNLNDGKIKNNTAKLIQSDDNDFTTTGDNVDVTAQFDQVIVESNAIKFYDNAENGFLIPNGSAKYYFVVVDINAAFTGSGTPPPTTFSTSSSNSNFNATAGTFQFSANNQVATNSYNCSKTQTFVALIDWIGANTNVNNWADNANWSPATVPGQYDIARIGVTANFTNNPSIQNNANLMVKGITFGSLKNATFNVDAGSSIAITDFAVLHPNTATAGEYRTNLTGGGNMVVQTMRIGDDQAPPSGLVNAAKSMVYSSIASLTINGNIVLKSIGNNSNGVNWPQFSGASGTINLNGQIETINTNTFYASDPNYYNDTFASLRGKFEFGNNTSAPAPTLILTHKSAILPIAQGFGIDFSFPDDATVRQSTVIYRNNSTDVQTIFPSGNLIIGRQPANYRNIIIEGSGPKTSVGMSENLIVGGRINNLITHYQDWTSSGGAIDFLTNNITLELRGSNQTYTGDNTPVVIGNLIATRGGTKTIAGGKFAISPAGVMTVTESSVNENTQFTANGNLTLKSNATASATVTALPAGCAINGNVNVERFVKGSPTDLSKRGYRLLSSTVNTATATIGGVSVRTYDPNYLLNSAFVSGLATGGFNVAGGGNPSLYLYREDLIPTGATFTSSNYKGLASLSTSSPFAVTTQNRPNTAYTSDTTVNIPVGTGMLFFFRGDKTNNATQSGTKTTIPFDYPEDVVFTSTGLLNQGTINVRTWYAKSDQTLLQYSTSIANNVSPRNVRGYHLLGNPYASSINWNKLNGQATVANSSLYGPNIERTVWLFNPTNKQYGAYLAPANADTVSTTPATGTNGASNIIASGQGFFIRTLTGGSTFRFLESAKTAVQPTASSLNLLMGIPVSTLQNEQPYMHIVMKKDAINDDDIIIRFDDSYSGNFNPLEDAEDMGGNGALLSLSALSFDKKTKIAIDGVPALSTVKSVPLFVDATTSGLYELHRKAFSGAADIYQVWLKDNFTKDSLDFRQNDTYNFRIDKSNTASFGENRFELVFRKKPLPPYELLAFTAEKVKEGALLKWKVLNEYAYTQFTIQKSDGSESYISIGKMNSDGAGNYSFIDTKYSGEMSSYRILQNKPDGTEAFSSIATLKNIPQKAFVIYPNPAPDYLIVELDAITTAKLRVTDSKGSVIRGTTFTGKSTRLNISNLKAGTYIIEVSDTSSFKLLGREKWIKL